MGLLGSVIGGITSIIGGNSQKKAASKAAEAQVKAAQMAIDEQRRQFDITQDNFAPYLGAGTSALGQIESLLGIATPQTSWGAYVNANPDLLAEWNGSVAKSGEFNDIGDYGKWHYDTYGRGEGRDISRFSSGQGGIAAQQQAIDALKGSPLYTSLIRNGEEALLANASATGGLRGGNTQGALANFRADTLADVINNQLANLGGIANMGQGAAGSLGQFGANAANQIGSNLNQEGAARAGAAIARGGITANQWQAGGDALDSVLSSIFGGGGIKL